MATREAHRPTKGASGRTTSPAVDGRSVGDLIRELGSESSRLVRQEVRLAKAEMRETVQMYERNLVKMVVGGVLLVGAAMILLVAANRGLTALLGQFMSVDLAVWLAPLVLGAVLGLIGWIMVKAAQRGIKGASVLPRRTMETLREERVWLTREAKEARHG